MGRMEKEMETTSLGFRVLWLHEPKSKLLKTVGLYRVFYRALLYRLLGGILGV